MIKQWVFNISIKLAMWACGNGFTHDFLVEAERQERAWQEIDE